jgi:hypothetical protein
VSVAAILLFEDAVHEQLTFIITVEYYDEKRCKITVIYCNDYCCGKRVS